MKNRVILIIGLTLFILIFAGSAYAEGNTTVHNDSNSKTNLQSGNTNIYVATSGNDNWDGTTPTHTNSTNGPKQHISNGLTVCKSGYTLNIASGTYYENNYDNKLKIKINLNIIGAGEDNTIINATNSDHPNLIFWIQSGCTVTIKNLTLTGGEASGTVDGDDGDDGGAVYNEGNLTIDNCIFKSNHARNGDNANAGTGHAGHGGDGGAIYNKGTLTVTNSDFKNNNAGKGGDASDIHDGDYGGSGGAVYNTGTSSFTNCTFISNYAGRGGNANAAADSAPGGQGGAIYNTATISIINCTFNSNYAGKGGGSSGLSWGSDGGYGGAIYNFGPKITIQNSTFTANHAGDGGDTQAGSGYIGGNGGGGGAICNMQPAYINMDILNCIFDGNYSGNGAEGSDIGNARNGGNGGAIYNANIMPNFTMNISGGEIKNNYTGTGGGAHGAFNAGSGGSGGAIYSSGYLTISNNCNIHNNTCGNGKNGATAGSAPGTGGYGGAIYSAGNLTISDSIIHDNQAGNSGSPAGSDTGAAGGNGGGIYNKSNLTLQNCEIYNNKAGAGGDGSDYFESGTKGGHGGNGGGIDNESKLTILGNTKIYSNTAGDGGDGHHSGEGGYGGGIYNNGTLKITGTSTIPIQIYSNTAGKGGVVGSDDEGGDYGKGGRAGGIYNKNSCDIDYATINNNTGGLGEFGGDGGAIYNESTLTLDDCIITGNLVKFNCKSGVPDGKFGGNGGGIFNAGNLTITDCQITNNKAADGPNGQDATWKKDQYYYLGTDGCPGGSGGGIYNSGTLTIIGSSITNNSAGKGGTGGKGEACFKDDEFPPDPPGLVGSSQVSCLDPGNGGNGGNGGGIFNSGTINSITNSTINNNTAGNGGAGGLYFDTIDAFDNIYKVNPAIAGIGGSGGGIYSTGKFSTLKYTTINNNTAGNGGNGNPVSRYPSENGNNGGNGGGLVIFKAIEIANCQISNNSAGNGGNGGTTYIQDNNPSTKPGTGGNAGSGGGIYVYYDNSISINSITINIHDNILDNNSAGTGGAGGIDDKDHNDSSNGGKGGNGGAIAIISAKTSNPPNYALYLFIEENTITHNKAGTGGQPYLTGIKGADGVGGGLYSSDNHNFVVDYNRIVDNTPQAIYLNLSCTNSYTNFWLNWWGSNADPKNNFAGTYIQSSYYSPWLKLNINAVPSNIQINGSSSVTANLLYDSNGGYHDPLNMHVPDGIPVAFGSNIGTINPQNSVTTNGASNTIFTPNSTTGNATVSATVDYQTVSTQIYVQPAADVVLTKITSNTMPNVGQQFYYTVTATNYGPDPATNIYVYDGIPTGLTYNSYSATQGTYTNGIWTVGTLNKATTAIIKIYVTPNNTIAGHNITNTATETQNEYDPSPATAQATIHVPSLNLTKTGYYNPGCDSIVWTINAKNDTGLALTNVVINDLISSDSQSYWNYYISYNDGVTWVQDGTYNPKSGNWTINELPASTTYVLTLYSTPLNGKSKNYSNTATSNIDNIVINASASVYVPACIIQLNQTATYIDNQIIWTIIINNTGPDVANLYVWDQMGYDSPGTSYNNYQISYDGGATWIKDGKYNPSDGKWDINGLDQTKTFMLKIYATPINGLGKTYTNTATSNYGVNATANIYVPIPGSQQYITLSQIIAAASTVKNYSELKNILPTGVSVGSQITTMSQLLYLLVTATINISNNISTSGTIKVVNPPTNPGGTYTSGILYKSSYITVAANIKNFIDTNGRAPNYAATSLGNIPFTKLVYMYSKIIDFYGINNRLPNYVTI